MAASLSRIPWRRIAPRTSFLRPGWNIPARYISQGKPTHAGGATSASASTPESPLAPSSPAEPVKLRVGAIDLAFSPLHLRDACKCAKCVDRHSHQKEFDTAEIPASVRPKEISEEIVDGERYTNIEWENDAARSLVDGPHVSRFKASELSKLAEPYIPTGDPRTDFRFYWNAEIFGHRQPWFDYGRYVSDKKTLHSAVRSLHRYGLAFVENVPDSVDSVVKVANRLGPLRNTFYGETWDVKSVPEAINVAYTNKFLGFHMDLMYMRDPPAFQLLHCVKNSFSGGESLFADTFAAAWKLYLEQPEMFWTLVEFPVHFGYDNGGHIYDFVRPTIELTPGTKLRDNSLRLRDIQYINYAPPFQQPFQPYLDDSHTRKRFRTDLEKYHAAIRRFTEILNEPANVFTLKLRAGDCVIFDNRRVVHARNAFEMSESQAAAMQRDGKPAERWLRGTYVDGDPVKSIMRVSKREDLMGWLRQSEDPPLVGHWRKGMGDPVEHAMEQMGLKGKENAHEHGCGGCGCGH